MFDVWQVIFYVKCWKKTLHKNTYTTKDTTLCEEFAVLFVTLHTYKELITEPSQDRLP